MGAEWQIVLKIKDISGQDAIVILELINESRCCNSEDGFRALMSSLKSLISFDFAISGMSNLSANGAITSYEILNINYPSEWLQVYVDRRYDQIDPIVAENYTSYKLQYWTDTYLKHGAPQEFIFNAEDFGLKEGYTIGFRNPGSGKGSIFTLSGKKMRKSPRTEAILNILMPHYHQVLLRLISKIGNCKATPLSTREVEVMNWLKHGKTSWDISRILNISERTVNFHCSSVMQKLDAVSRTHALAIAIDKGMVTFE